MFFSPAEIFALLDYAPLSEAETESSVTAHLLRAQQPEAALASFTVLQPFVALARRVLPRQVAVATVANFPNGTQTAAAVYAELRGHIGAGCDEVAFLFPYRAFVTGNTSSALELCEGVAQLCHDHGLLLRVILESGVLGEADILACADAAIRAGADMLQTSSGRAEKGASAEAALLLLNRIAAAPRELGLVIADGVHDVETARSYLVQAAAVMGRTWLTPAHFRISGVNVVEAVLSGLRD